MESVFAVQMIHPQTTDAVPSFGGGTSNTQNFRQFGSDLVLTPAQLVEGLDNYIVGQAEGKRVRLMLHDSQIDCELFLCGSIVATCFFTKPFTRPNGCSLLFVRLILDLQLQALL